VLTDFKVITDALVNSSARLQSESIIQAETGQAGLGATAVSKTA
jgi:hypothetical protein